MYARITFNLAASLILFGLAGCASTGSGQGTVRNGGTVVSFDWKSVDDVSGTLTATFADGQVFTGQYFQITGDVRIDRMTPLWDGWHHPWHGWPYWSADAGPNFGKYYSGRVLANLRTTSGEYMRCRFRLIRPSQGLSGGAQGTCQHPDGKTIDATLGPEK
jgi:hypothetical protein